MRKLETAWIFWIVLSGAVLLSAGCATDRSMTGNREIREREFGTLRSEPSGKEADTAERVQSLERSVSLLQARVAEMQDRLKTVQGHPPISVYRLPEGVTLCGERIPLEDRKIWEGMDQEFLAALGNEATLLLWVKRSQRYFPHIEKRLREMGLPDDLKYVTITESSLRPTAVSYSGAAGIWQFIPSTGEKYGMRGKGMIDERLDFFKATDGALEYLKSLNEEFKSWSLAMAAYNAGENRIRREITLQRTKDYFYLDLPLETKRYVYKIAVAKIILSDPKRYGIELDDRVLYGPLQVERVQVNLPIPMAIIEVASALGVYYKDIKEMNLHFTGENIPAGVHSINLPAGTTALFWSFFENWKKEVDSKK